MPHVTCYLLFLFLFPFYPVFFGNSPEPVVDGESSESSTLDTKESEDKNENIKQLVTPNNRPNVSSASAPLPLPAVSSSNDSSVIPMSLDENLTPSLLETGSDHHTKKDHDTNTGEQLASSSLPQGQEKPSLTTEHSAKQPVSSEPVVSTQDGVKDMEQEKPLTLSTTEASVKDPLALSTQDTSGKESHVKRVMKRRNKNMHHFLLHVELPRGL